MLQYLIYISCGVAIGIIFMSFFSLSKRCAMQEEHNRDTEFYERQIKSLEKDIQFWRDKCLNNGCSQYTIDIYKDLLSKFMDGPSATTDKFFMFEGKPYRPTEFTLDREEGRNETLDVTFVECGL